MVLLPYALMMRKPDYCLATSACASLSCRILIHRSSLLATPANKWHNQQLHLHFQQHLEISELKIVFRAQVLKFAVTAVHSKHTEQKHNVAVHMKHRTATAEKYYCSSGRLVTQTDHFELWDLRLQTSSICLTAVSSLNLFAPTKPFIYPSW